MRIRNAWLGLAAWLLAGGSGLAAQTQARLLIAAETARPGDTILAGVQLRMPAGWHTYWRNGGDAGAPTRIEWTLPAGVSAGEILWPVPEKFTAAGLTTYGYHDEVVLLAPLRLAQELPPGPVTLKAKISWLECKELCLPGKSELTARVIIGPQVKASAEAALLDSWEKRLPRQEPKLGAHARWEQPPAGDTRPLLIEWTPVNSSSGLDFYPYEAKAFDVGGDTEVLPGSGQARIRKQVKKLEGNWPGQIGGLLVEKSGPRGVAGYEVTLPVDQSPPGSGSVPGAALWPVLGMLGLAFLGGLILNIMPCVLPVLALKILGFVQQSRQRPERVRRLGLVYGAGVLCSFLALAALVIGVQQAGRAASWGMQFQNPEFVVAMTTLVTLVALNLFGVFAVSLGGRALDAASAISGAHGSLGAFFNGVLATALATPCTAPFLTVALGFAFIQSPQMIVVMFVVMGLGLALPYVLLSWFPQWLSVLPKPGRWMERFKVAMGFPMLATAVWLLTLTGAHYGSRGPLWVGLFLVALGLAAWLWGEFVQRGAGRRGWIVALCVALVGTGYGYGLEKQLRWRSPQAAALNGPPRSEAAGIPWQPWSPSAVSEARAQGRPVLVDFTADWCVTCQANKVSSLEVDPVRKRLLAIGAVALMADYTREDPAITAELRRFGRAGVPLVLVYPRDPRKPPQVLPAFLTPGIVLSALEKAVQ